MFEYIFYSIWYVYAIWFFIIIDILNIDSPCYSQCYSICAFSLLLDITAPCTSESSFKCSYAMHHSSCLHLTVRCNGRNDCGDGSDESYCGKYYSFKCSYAMQRHNTEYHTKCMCYKYCVHMFLNKNVTWSCV